MKKHIMINKEGNQKLEVTILNFSDWESFGELVQFIENYYEAKILKKYDGPDASKWIFNCRGKIIELVYDDFYGNYFIAPTPESEQIVLEIAKDLDERLKNIESK